MTNDKSLSEMKRPVLANKKGKTFTHSYTYNEEHVKQKISDFIDELKEDLDNWCKRHKAMTISKYNIEELKQIPYKALKKHIGELG